MHPQFDSGYKINLLVQYGLLRATWWHGKHFFWNSNLLTCVFNPTFIITAHRCWRVTCLPQCGLVRVYALSTVGTCVVKFSMWVCVAHTFVCVYMCVMCMCVSAYDKGAHSSTLGVWNLFLSPARVSLCKQHVNSIEFLFSPLTLCVVKELGKMDKCYRRV